MMGREARRLGLAAVLLTVLGCGGAATEPKAEPKADTSPDKATKAPATEPAVDEAPREPATVEAATKVLDLRKFPRPEGAKLMGRPALGSLSYEVKADLKEAYEFARKGLVEAGWKMLPDARVDDKYAQANFSREGFAATISAYPGDAGMVNVSIHNYGNVPASQIPVPADLKVEYKFAQTAGYMTKTAKVPQVAEAIQKLLVEKGWLPYGGVHSYDQKFSAGQSMEFKRNAIMVHVSVTTHENRPGDTMVQISMKLLSADLPAPPNALANNFHFDDGARTLTFETADKTDDVGKFYRETLAKQGWQPTTDPKGLIDMLLVFRNSAKDMIMLDVKGKKSPTRVKLTYYTAADVAEFDKRAQDKGKEEKK